MHIRTQIRAKLKEILSTISNLNIFTDYVYAIDEKKMPFVSVLTGSEQIEKVSIGNPSVLNRELSFGVIICVRANEDYQDIVDSLIKEIELKLNNNKTLDGLVHNSNLETIEIEVDDESDKITAYAKMNYVFSFRCMSDNVDISI